MVNDREQKLLSYFLQLSEQLWNGSVSCALATGSLL